MAFQATPSMSAKPQTDLAAHVRDIPDFPKPGIVFKDVTPLLKSPAVFQEVVDRLAQQAAPLKPDFVVGIESRGFLFGAPLALQLGAGFLPVRKPGKLPYEVERIDYSLEYGSGSLEIHADALTEGHRVLIVDDLLATGGTAYASRALVERLGGTVVGAGFVIELAFLEGRNRLEGVPVFSLLTY